MLDLCEEYSHLVHELPVEAGEFVCDGDPQAGASMLSFDEDVLDAEARQVGVELPEQHGLRSKHCHSLNFPEKYLIAITEDG